MEKITHEKLITLHRKNSKHTQNECLQKKNAYKKWLYYMRKIFILTKIEIKKKDRKVAMEVLGGEKRRSFPKRLREYQNMNEKIQVNEVYVKEFQKREQFSKV